MNSHFLQRENKYLIDAKKLIDLEMAGAALMSCRNAIEVLVKELCKECGLQYDSRETDLSIMIDNLFEANIISGNTKDLLHRSRITCNKAAHVDSNVSISDAQETVEMIETCYKSISDINTETVQQAKMVNNVPMSNPDYYSRNRLYYGKWANCLDRKSLMVIPEYVELEHRFYSGDIGAALNIAVGFLPQNILWSSDKLINMPSYMYRGQAFNQDKVYDKRYYFWVMNAVSSAYYRMDTFPRKYIATAIWESFYAWFNIAINPMQPNYVSGVNEWYDNSSRQYKYEPIYADPDELMEAMFDPVPDLSDNVHYFGLNDNGIAVARNVFGDSTYTDCVSPIYEEAMCNPLLKIRFMRYCAFAFYNNCFLDDPSSMLCIKAIDAEEMNRDYMMLSQASGNQSYNMRVSAGDVFSWEMLMPYTAGTFCNDCFNLARYYEGQVNKKMNKYSLSGLTDSVRGFFGV